LRVFLKKPFGLRIEILYVLMKGKAGLKITPVGPFLLFVTGSKKIEEDQKYNDQNTSKNRLSENGIKHGQLRLWNFYGMLHLIICVSDHGW